MMGVGQPALLIGRADEEEAAGHPLQEDRHILGPHRADVGQQASRLDVGSNRLLHDLCDFRMVDQGWCQAGCGHLHRAAQGLGDSFGNLCQTQDG